MRGAYKYMILKLSFNRYEIIYTFDISTKTSQILVFTRTGNMAFSIQDGCMFSHKSTQGNMMQANTRLNRSTHTGNMSTPNWNASAHTG